MQFSWWIYSGKEFHNIGAIQLKALPPKKLNFKCVTLSKSADNDLKERVGVYS